MDIKGVGVDILRISRIKDVYLSHGERFLHRICSEQEINYVMRSRETLFDRLSALFCAKEAVFKTLHTRNPIIFKEIEIIHLPYPVVKLHGKTLHIALQREIKNVLVSISHDSDICVAFAIAI